MKAMHSILIADESNVTQHILTARFINAGYPIRTVSGENELKISLRIDSISLVLLSIGFCENNPFVLVRELRKINPNIKIIIMATSLSISETVAFMKSGVTDCVVKPFQTEALLKKIQQIFEAEDVKESVNSGQLYKMDLYSASNAEETNPIIREIDSMVDSIRNYRINVLITGETGTGKSLYAKKIHYGDITRNEPFVSFNCEAVLPEEMEKTLFGECTRNDDGTIQRIKGRMEQAGKGTLFIQGLDNMPLELQSKIVNVLQEKFFEPVGDDKMLPFEARIIATMTISPEHGIAANKIRTDLYYQLNEVRIDLPPLRMCKDRIPGLVQSMMRNLSKETNIPISHVSDNYWNVLSNHDWPGNVRELANVVKYSFLIARGKDVTSSMLPMSVNKSTTRKTPNNSNEEYFDLHDYIKSQEKEIILQTLEKFDGNKIKTAQYLRISERALRYKINEFNSD